MTMDADSDGHILWILRKEGRIVQGTRTSGDSAPEWLVQPYAPNQSGNVVCQKTTV
jgi:hypothetical protein